MTSHEQFIDCYCAELQRKLRSSLKFFPDDWDERYICALAVIILLRNQHNLNDIVHKVRSSLTYGYLDI
ncbi:hypothetical protein UABAM_05024 [Candidatus Uabimicrobium amorphum]|uniref:Uncharacterized protein n=1 Tax=Uabimicrobium amorphum TaxID=2596890 RepID=A0A5S9IR88_UABAM|nr:hypothetical protein UABAM_05024 [Candidatus Uabimicrobium amorphum]